MAFGIPLNVSGPLAPMPFPRQYPDSIPDRNMFVEQPPMQQMPLNLPGNVSPSVLNALVGMLSGNQPPEPYREIQTEWQPPHPSMQSFLRQPEPMQREPMPMPQQQSGMDRIPPQGAMPQVPYAWQPTDPNNSVQNFQQLAGTDPQANVRNYLDSIRADSAAAYAENPDDPRFANIAPMTPQEQQSQVESKLRSAALAAKIRNDALARDGFTTGRDGRVIPIDERISLNDYDLNAMGGVGALNAAGQPSVFGMDTRRAFPNAPQRPDGIPLTPDMQALRGQAEALAEEDGAVPIELLREQQDGRGRPEDIRSMLFDHMRNVLNMPEGPERDAAMAAIPAIRGPERNSQQQLADRENRFAARRRELVRHGLGDGTYDERMAARGVEQKERRDQQKHNALVNQLRRQGINPVVAQALVGGEGSEAMDRFNRLRDPRGAAWLDSQMAQNERLAAAAAETARHNQAMEGLEGKRLDGLANKEQREITAKADDAVVEHKLKNGAPPDPKSLGTLYRGWKNVPPAELKSSLDASYAAGGVDDDGNPVPWTSDTWEQYLATTFGNDADAKEYVKYGKQLDISRNRQAIADKFKDDPNLYLTSPARATRDRNMLATPGGIGFGTF